MVQWGNFVYLNFIIINQSSPTKQNKYQTKKKTVKFYLKHSRQLSAVLCTWANTITSWGWDVILAATITSIAHGSFCTKDTKIVMT